MYPRLATTTSAPEPTEPPEVPAALRRRPRRSLIPILLPALGISLLMMLMLMSSLQPASSASASQVRREIRALVLARSDKPGIDDGGSIGSWWVSAADADPTTGTLRSFRVSAGPTIIAAEEAELVIDSDLNAFSFELRGVVIIRLGIEGSAPPEPNVLELDAYRLGPIPYHREIEPDGGEPSQPPLSSQPADVSPLTRAE